MELVIVSGAEVQPEAMLHGEKLPQGYVGQREILRNHGHLGMSLCPASEVLPGILPKLISPHALAVQLVRDSLDGHLDFLDLGVLEGLCVSLEGCRRILEEKQDALHWPCGDVQIDIPECCSCWPWFSGGVGPGRIRWRGGPHTGSESAARGHAVWPYRTPRRCFQPCRKRRRRQSLQRRGSSRWKWVHIPSDPLGQIGRRVRGSGAVQSQAVYETGCRRQARLQHLQFQTHPCFQPRRESYPRSGHPIGQCPGTGNYSFPGQFSRGPGSSGTCRSHQYIAPHSQRSW